MPTVSLTDDDPTHAAALVAALVQARGFHRCEPRTAATTIERPDPGSNAPTTEGRRHDDGGRGAGRPA
jgi:hypothetical protein